MVRSDRALVDAMHSLERSNAQIVLVVDEAQRMVGTLTDGDIRRALLQGKALDAPLLPHLRREFVSVDPGATRAEVIDLMQARFVQQIPIVDSDGRLVGLHLLREILGAVERPNWAVIMAGGEGLRLRPLTEHVPKPMLRVAGRPILERIVLHLVGFGVRRIFLAVNYRAEVIEEYFGDGLRFGCRIDYLREKKLLGTGGALSLLPVRPETALLVLNGDLITQFDVGRLLDFHDRGGFPLTVGIHDYSHTVPFGVLDTDGDRVVAFREKPRMAWHTNAGIYVLSPAVLDRIPGDTVYDLPGLILDCLSRNEPVGGFPIEEDWIDVGRERELARARGTLEKP